MRYFIKYINANSFTCHDKIMNIKVICEEVIKILVKIKFWSKCRIIEHCCNHLEKLTQYCTSSSIDQDIDENVQFWSKHNFSIMIIVSINVCSPQ